MVLSELKQFQSAQLSAEQITAIMDLAAQTRGNIVRMITRAGSGHVGGSLSSVDMYLLLWLCANVSPETTDVPDRDRIVVSHGHTSAAVYSVLGGLGYYDITEALESFRRDGSAYEGHPSLKVPGVEWCSGSLGQGLSVACGFALSAKLKKNNAHTFVVMGDGEQGKGQLQEAREFAAKYNLGNLTALIDYNQLQASGTIGEVMPQNIREKYTAAGWRVIDVDGHDYAAVYTALRESYEDKGVPVLILAHTVMGKGVSFIENNFAYHGKVLTAQQTEQALAELGCSDAECCQKKDMCACAGTKTLAVLTGTSITYAPGVSVDCRSAFGDALLSIAQANIENKDLTIAAFDCDLAESVKLQKLLEAYPNMVIECGIQEHNAATTAAALSKTGVLTFYADFGVFGVDETFSQHRMADLNHSALKLVCTHVGLDVGEDGKTHQCIDYISLISNLYGYKMILPADANQTDRALRFAAQEEGNVLLAMGRSKLPVLTDEEGKLIYGEDYTFTYGQADWLRKGTDGTIITYGTLTPMALEAANLLKTEGISVGVLNISCPLALDEEKIAEAARTGLIVTYEDHNVRTGLGSIIGTHLAEKGLNCTFRRVGIKEYGASASPACNYRRQGMDAESLVQLIKSLK